jgi:hypothetical protein
VIGISAQEIGQQAAQQAGGALKKTGSKTLSKAVGKAAKLLRKLLMQFIKKLILALLKMFAAYLGFTGCLVIIVIIVVLLILSAIPFADWFLGGNARSDEQKNADLKYEQELRIAADATVAELYNIEADTAWINQLVKTVKPSWGIPAALVRYELLVNHKKKVRLEDYDPKELIKSFQPQFTYTTITDDKVRYKTVRSCTYTEPDGDRESQDQDTPKRTWTETTTTYSEQTAPAHKVLSKVAFDYGELEIKSLKRYYPGGTLQPTDNWEYVSSSSSSNCTSTTYKQYERTTVDDRYVPNLVVDGSEFQRVLMDLGVKETDLKLFYEMVAVADPDWNPALYGGKPFYGEWLPGTAMVSDLVWRYEPLVRKYLALKGMEEHTHLILAMIMQESGGRSLDVMQSSESLGLPPNSITDPEISIQAGINHFAAVYEAAGGDIKLALQAYNFGGGFISYAQQRGGYSKEVALEYSQMMAEKMGWKRYGDPLYVDHVLRYYNATNYTLKIVPGEQVFDVQEVLNVMTQYLGLPYVWGGKSPEEGGFDCSGLISYAFAQIGIDLSGNAHTQYNKTVAVSEDDAKPGDLVFWETYKNAPSHVGMYLGDGNFINASSSKGVTFDTLSRWKNYKFLGFRRVVQ